MATENINKITKDFVVIWLDKTIEDNKDNQNTKAFIRQLVKGRLLTFDDQDKCIDHCGDRKSAEIWAKPYSKVSGIFTRRAALLDKIGKDVGVCDKDEDLPMSIFHLTERENTLQQLTKESATFMWYCSVLIVLRLMATYGDSKSEMIAECQAAYHDNETEQKKINDFERNYCAKEVFSWYTKDSFVYRLLNKALRTQNIEVIFKFRFFINDLHNQIEQFYYQYLDKHSSIIDHHLKVYRGQRLKMTEIDILKRNVNELISMSSFLSTTLNEELAKVFAGTSGQLNEPSPLQSVLFIIDICNMNKEMTPFAILENSPCSQDNGEEEVLFSIGAIFKIQSVKQQGNMWYVHLQLSKEQNEDSQNLSDHMIKQIGPKPDPLSFCWVLFRMSEYEKAEHYAKYMLTLFLPNDKGIGNTYNLLGLIYYDTHKLEQSIECYEKALDIYSQLNCHDSSQAIATHCSLGLAYLASGDTRNAEEQQTLAENKLSKSSQFKNPLLTSQVESLKAKIQAEYGDDISALKSLELVLKDKEQRLPSAHPSIVSTLSAIGIVHENMNNYVKAFEYFKRALELGKKSLQNDHKDLAEYYMNIARIYDKQQQFKLALQQFELALNIMWNYREEEGAKIAELSMHIDNMRKKLY
ncbi:unnamed protein product [Rotaria sordida]|uniref:Nephrocystin-3 n=1 Tax=Rotaria sordida TaxID=392033 RepID=A0A814WKZ8_9BILA|nr:unnamed protein product [Rotaria sordida]CAF4026053.1 unnamed protein product [Rotaria sordida]